MNGRDITGSAIAQIGKPGLCGSSAPVLRRKGHAVPASHVAGGRGAWRDHHVDSSMPHGGAGTGELDSPAGDRIVCSLVGTGGLGRTKLPQLCPSTQGAVGVQPWAVVSPSVG